MDTPDCLCSAFAATADLGDGVPQTPLEPSPNRVVGGARASHGGASSYTIKPLQQNQAGQFASHLAVRLSRRQRREGSADTRGLLGACRAWAGNWGVGASLERKRCQCCRWRGKATYHEDMQGRAEERGYPCALGGCRRTVYGADRLLHASRQRSRLAQALDRQTGDRRSTATSASRPLPTGCAGSASVHRRPPPVRLAWCCRGYGQLQRGRRQRQDKRQPQLDSRHSHSRRDEAFCGTFCFGVECGVVRGWRSCCVRVFAAHRRFPACPRAGSGERCTSELLHWAHKHGCQGAIQSDANQHLHPSRLQAAGCELWLLVVGCTRALVSRLLGRGGRKAGRTR
eukprot:scaffold7822_cov146-Isochrysis_galbana.AAC.1